MWIIIIKRKNSLILIPIFQPRDLLQGYTLEEIIKESAVKDLYFPNLIKYQFGAE